VIEVHVVPHGNAWALEVAGDPRESFDTRYEAIRSGRELAEQKQGRLVIHGKDDPIRARIRRQDPRGIPG